MQPSAFTPVQAHPQQGGLADTSHPHPHMAAFTFTALASASCLGGRRSVVFVGRHTFNFPPSFVDLKYQVFKIYF